MVWIVALLLGVSAEASNCQTLKADLREFQAAQAQILASLNSNHETAASSLEEYSELVGLSAERQSMVLSKKMNESAQAFRARGVKGKQITAQLQQGTEELMVRVQNCLK